jgi:hypothetical protein
MKNMILIGLLIMTLCSCVQQNLTSPAIMKRQFAFMAELKGYSLPSITIPSKLPSSTPSFKLYLIAEQLAAQQGLISDGTLSPQGKLVVGKKIDGDSVIIGIQFIEFDDGRITFEYITQANGLHIEACQKMEKVYVAALKKEFYLHFPK